MRRRGVSVIYLMLILIILLFFVSIGVDMGRVRVARSQLSVAADAASFAGVQALPSADHSLAISRAIAVAASNKADGTAVALQAAGDIQFGLFRITTRIYTPVGGTEPGTGHQVNDAEANAMKVTARRMQSRGNPINLIFARILGRTTFDAWGQATAVVLGGPTRFGIVGLDFVNANGNNAVIDSYDPSLGSYESQPRRENASVASNGIIDMGNGDIYGDARPGVDKWVDQKSNSIITGWIAPLDTPLSYPPAVIPGNPATLPNAFSIPGGIYQTSSTFPPRKSTTFSGPATVYVNNAKVDLKGNSVVTSGNLPGNLKIFVIGNKGVDIGGNSKLYAQLYAPQSGVTLHGTPGFYGALVGKNIDIKGTSDIHYDESTNPLSVPRRSALIK